MEQLIEITTVPIKYQLKVQNASLNYKSSLAEVEITRDQGEMKIRSKPIKLRMDTFDARNSIAPTTKTSITQAAQKGARVAYEATANLINGLSFLGLFLFARYVSSLNSGEFSRDLFCNSL